MFDNIQYSDVVPLFIWLVLYSKGGVFPEFLVYERAKKTFPQVYQVQGMLNLW